MPKEIICLIVGPSGVGKTTVAKFMCEEYGMSQIASYTDRPPRYEGEKEHVFLLKEEFDKLPPLCAYTEYNGHRYGTTEEQVNNNELYVIDIPGVIALKQNYTGPKDIFVVGLTQDIAVLRARMKIRGDSDTAISKRLATDSIAFSKMSEYCDVIMSNKNIKATAKCIVEFIEAQKNA